MTAISFGGASLKGFVMEDLAMLVDAGMDASTALAAIEKDMRARWMIYLLQRARYFIDSGSSIWEAFAKTKFAQPHIIALIRIGEQAGQLPENLRTVVLQQQKERVFRSKVQAAMTYPVFVLGLTVIVGIGVAWFILPRLATVFGSLDMDLPLVTEILMMIGAFLQEYGQIAAPVAILIFIFLLWVVFAAPKTKVIGQWLLFIMPGVRKLIREIELARFGFVLGTLLKSGLPIVDSIEALEKAAIFNRYKKFYRNLAVQIEDGGTFREVFESKKRSRALIPSAIQQMVVTAEQSGHLPEILLQIGETFEVKIDTTTKNLSVILEPILLVIVWLGVVAVAMAIILPIYSLVGGLTSSASPNAVIEVEIEEPETQDLSLEDVLGVIPFGVEEEVEEEARESLLTIASPAGVLNVRALPDTASTILVQAANGEQFEITSQEGDWYEVVLDSETGETGWVFSEYIELYEPEEAE